jgi:hypothetical protein
MLKAFEGPVVLRVSEREVLPVAMSMLNMAREKMRKAVSG